MCREARAGRRRLEFGSRRERPQLDRRPQLAHAILSLFRWTLPCFGVAVSVACGSNHATGLGGDGVGGPNGDDASGGSFGQDDGGGGGPGGGFAGGDGGGGGDAGPVIPITTTFVDNCSTGTPSGLSATSVKALLAGGSAGSMRYLYPYAQTVFPRGLIAPTLMWDGASADYVYVHLKSKAFEYKGCLAPTAAGQLLLPQNIWVAASAHAVGAADPFSLSLTTISAATVTGPITEPIVIAPATLKGSIYYNSYTSKLATGAGGGGAVLRIVPGQNVTLFLGSNGCTGCHAVSANGARLVADPFLMSIQGSGATYALTPTGSREPRAPRLDGAERHVRRPVPGRLLYIGNAHPNGGLGGPRPGGPLATGPASAGLYETDTGNAVSNSDIPTGAMMPMFSPDGKRSCSPTRRSETETARASRPWPSTWRPARRAPTRRSFRSATRARIRAGRSSCRTTAAIVFAIGNQADFSGARRRAWASGARSPRRRSDLYLLDVASGTSTLLARPSASPRRPTPRRTRRTCRTARPTSSPQLLPDGVSRSPPAATSGSSSTRTATTATRGCSGSSGARPSTSRPTASTRPTPSHPAFYVTGQELGTGDHRAFTALDPCHADGALLHDRRRLLRRFLHQWHVRRRRASVLEHRRDLQRGPHLLRLDARSASAGSARASSSSAGSGSGSGSGASAGTGTGTGTLARGRGQLEKPHPACDSPASCTLRFSLASTPSPPSIRTSRPSWASCSGAVSPARFAPTTRRGCRPRPTTASTS